jgi:dihydropteroate synthase
LCRLSVKVQQKAEAMSRILFVTGKLAEPALRRLLGRLAPQAGFAFEVAVLPISVASLATTRWIASHLAVPEGVSRIILPGLCQGPLEEVQSRTAAPVERGPEDLRDLPDHFHAAALQREGYGAHSLEILAEINHAPRLPLAEIVRQAGALAADGADVIDLGCDPGGGWSGVGEAVRALRGEGLRVSIDTFDPVEAEAAVRAGAELVLSVNASNREQAAGWGAEVVVVPDGEPSVPGMADTIEYLATRGVRLRIDPILAPIGLGFAPSLGRYLEARKAYPALPILMGVGNVTEMTDADSCGINVLLAGFCQEAGITSVLTTQVANWARSSVQELDLARRLLHFAVTHGVAPKRLEPGLLLLRDPRVREHGPEGLAEIARHVRDRNWRLFAEGGALHAISAAGHFSSDDPFELFTRLPELSPSHAFYLGYELAKAMTALTLGKAYHQDRALRWGFLTREERPGSSGRQPPGEPPP